MTAGMFRQGMVLILLTIATAWADTDEFIERTGDVLQVALPLTALTATYTLDDPDGRTQLLLAYGSTMGLTYLGKYTIGKERPDGSDNLSFPSGHTSSAFSGASFLARRYGWDVGLPAYLAASFTGYSRVHANRHDEWDVLAGAALAIGINHWLVSPQANSTVSVLPTDQGLVIGYQHTF